MTLESKAEVSFTSKDNVNKAVSKLRLLTKTNLYHLKDGWNAAQLNSLHSVENKITTGDTERRSGKHTWGLIVGGTGYWELLPFLVFHGVPINENIS